MRKVYIEKNGVYLHFISIDGLVMCPMASTDHPCMVRCAWFNETESGILEVDDEGNHTEVTTYYYACKDTIIGEKAEEGEKK